MPKYVSPEITTKIKALKDFHHLLERFLEELNREDPNYNQNWDKINRMTLFLMNCIHEFDKIDDSLTAKFAFEIECLEKTYNLIFINSDYQHCQEYIHFATTHSNSADNKQKLGTAMKWLGGLVFILTPIAFVVATNPMIIVAAAAVVLIALIVAVEGIMLEKQHSKKIPVPLNMSKFAQARDGFFQLNNRIDNFEPDFTAYCQEHQELHTDDMDGAFDRFFNN